MCWMTLPETPTQPEPEPPIVTDNVALYAQWLIGLRREGMIPPDAFEDRPGVIQMRGEC